ncbi:tripartite tricarboxylate transporter substrate binding protein [Cupriavidus sp. CV2]|uniref:Bug family tripartite tricarboxylate transporter substrate binding protein n=1 Tax=Cupriavidus ulmosensis TaxID=3065913 RepID=UPI00296ACD16|nr:tripartite tricarboxylate transporter substrate binding protein [Cupriavidus sp. CV2]MDW3685826.1 tripartite tricarboxylate transporter substrate binding protein [Cupriavidus sp. CV2]
MFHRLSAPLRAATLALLLCAPGLAAHAQERYPAKPVRFVNTFPPGGPSDLLARSVAELLQGELKQAFVVENKPGAGGNLGAGAVAKSPADGYAVLFGIDTTFTVNPHIYSTMPFRPGELKPLMILASSGLLVGTSPSSGIASLPDLVKQAKAKRLNFSSGGSGSPGHLAIEEFQRATGLKLNHVPYKGSTPAVTAVVGSEVDGGFLATPSMLPFVKAGKVTALAVTSRQRSRLAPGIATVAELGMKDLEHEVLYVAMVPAATPEPVVRVLERAIADALARPDVQARMQALDLQPEGVTGAAAARRLSELSDRYRQLIVATGMKVE